MPRSRSIPAPITASRFRSARSTIATPPSGIGNGCWRSIAAISDSSQQGSEMRLLAFSDIHHNLVAVRKLRACEKNDFDAVIVAGDIGNESAAEFFRILETFECPVMYVYGNWDNKLDYESCFSPRCHLIHSNVITVGELSFTGFSGCPTDWGKNPLARGIYRRIESQHQRVLDALKDGPKAAQNIQRTRAYQNYVSQLQEARDEILKRNTESIAHAVKAAGVDTRRCVVVAHQRVPRLNDE